MAGKSPSDRLELVRDDEGANFGRYRIFPRLRILVRDGVKIELGPRAIDVLWCLVEADGGLVPKDCLLERVWSGVPVDENNLQAQISAIRRALGSDRDMVRTELGLGYRLVKDDAGRPLANPGPGKSPLLALPTPLTSLLGRDVELQDVEALFGKHRLLTIVGEGGVGKTRLILELGHRLSDRHTDDVRLVEMAKVSEGRLAEHYLAAALQIPTLDVKYVRDFSSNRSGCPIVLLIDNCEHISGWIAEPIEAILTHSSQIKIVATSQESLGLSGEQVYRLGPLAVPPSDTTDMELALKYPAFALLVERASASVKNFQTDIELASAICRRLDGLPLALELAAARVATLGLGGVLAALNDRFNLLTAGRKTALAKHRTLRATVDWSYHLLDPDEQLLLRRISVFSSAFDIHAVRAVATPETADPWYSVDLLGRLATKSLLTVDLTDGRPRYRFLESIRFYALEKLADDSDRASIMERYAAHILNIAQRANDDWKTLSTDEWRSTHAEIIDDIRAALDWSFSGSGDMQVGTSLLACATPFWVQLSLHDECRRRISEALERFAGDLRPSEELALQAALGTALSWAVGPVAETGEAWEKALLLAEQQGACEIELQARYGLWLFHLRSGRFQASYGHSQEMLRRSLDADDEEAAAVAQRIAGVSQHFLGNHDLARNLLERSLSWFNLNHPPQTFRFGLDQTVACKSFLARTLWVLGHVDDAKGLARHAVSEAEHLDHANTLCCALAEGECTVNAFEGDCASVRRAVGALRQVARRHGLGFWETYASLFEMWATIESGTSVTAAEISALIEAVTKSGFHPKYSNLFSVMHLAIRRNGWDETPLLGISYALLDNQVSEPSWADVEFRRVAFQLGPSSSSHDINLWDELGKAKKQNALSWALKIAMDIVTYAPSENNKKASRALQNLIDQFPATSSGNHLHAARSLAAARRHPTEGH